MPNHNGRGEDRPETGTEIEQRIAAAVQLQIHTAALQLSKPYRGVPWCFVVAIIALSVHQDFAGRHVTTRQYHRLLQGWASEATLRRWLARLEDAGLLAGEGEKPRRYRPTAQARQVLVSFFQRAIRFTTEATLRLQPKGRDLRPDEMLRVWGEMWGGDITEL